MNMISEHDYCSKINYSASEISSSSEETGITSFSIENYRGYCGAHAGATVNYIREWCDCAADDLLNEGGIQYLHFLLEFSCGPRACCIESSFDWVHACSEALMILFWCDGV